MALNFGSGPTPPKQPENHDDLLAALNAAVGEAIGGKPKQTSTVWQRLVRPRSLLLALRIVVGVLVLGAGFWTVGYILAWQNFIPFVPEWWHGLAIAVTWCLFQTLAPPMFVTRRR